MAKKVRSQARPKRQTEPKRKAQKLLAKVPEEHVFWCHDGTTFRDMRELAEGLAAMSDDVFAYHVNSEKNDFCNWIRDVIRDEDLASEVRAATTRLQTASFTSARVARLVSSLS